MRLLLTTAIAIPVLVQKCMKQDPNQFRMPLCLSIHQFYFYCTNFAISKVLHLVIKKYI